MRSLAGKLTIAFGWVSMIGILCVSLLASRASGTQVNSLLNQQEQQKIAQEIAEHFADFGNWREVDRAIRNQYEPRDFVVINGDDRVILMGSRYRLDERVDPALTQSRIPIEVNGRIEGYFVSLRPRGASQQRAIQNQAIMQTINRSIFLGALGALLASLMMGLILARWISKPIKEITAASHAIAQGNLAQQVPVRSTDEVGELAQTFNKMSADLAQSQQQRQQMTADIAHDLRTPLSLILGHAEAIEDGVLPATPETLHIIYDEANRLNHLIEDLRTLTLADTGQLTVQKRLVHPEELINRAGSAHLPIAKEKQIVLLIDVAEDLPEIAIDPQRIGQVLDNLVSNAIRYTPENGRIWLSAQNTASHIQFTIRDSGAGIRESDLQHLFDRFYRADKARTRSEGGSGLGLAIAKSLVQQHQGRIWVESEVGQGTAFHFTLPY